MLSLIGGWDFAGKGNVAPLAKRTSRAFAVAITGAPSPLREMAPVHVHCPESSAVTGCGLNFRVASAGAVVKTGDSNFRKCVKGVASSPGGGLIAARLRLYSGTRINTLRKKLVRVAPARRSPLFASASTVLTCSRTSSGHANERATTFATDDLNVSAS